MSVKCFQFQVGKSEPSSTGIVTLCTKSIYADSYCYHIIYMHRVLKRGQSTDRALQKEALMDYICWSYQLQKWQVHHWTV